MSTYAQISSSVSPKYHLGKFDEIRNSLTLRMASVPKLQVADPVVVSDAIFVMDKFITCDSSSELARHDECVLQDPPLTVGVGMTIDSTNARSTFTRTTLTTWSRSLCMEGFLWFSAKKMKAIMSGTHTPAKRCTCAFVKRASFGHLAYVIRGGV